MKFKVGDRVVVNSTALYVFVCQKNYQNNMVSDIKRGDILICTTNHLVKIGIDKNTQCKAESTEFYDELKGYRCVLVKTLFGTERLPIIYFIKLDDIREQKLQELLDYEV